MRRALSIIAAAAALSGLTLANAPAHAAPAALVAEVEPGETDGSDNPPDPGEGNEWNSVGGAQGADVDVVTGRIANSSTSSSTIRSYNSRYSTTRFKASNCAGDIRTVYPGQITPIWYDADCIRMQSGNYKVTGIVKVFNVWGTKIAEKNIGCTSNRFDVAVQGTEVGRVYYARKCY